METIRLWAFNKWRIGTAPFHLFYYLAWIAAVVYFCYPQFIIKATPIWLCALSCILHNGHKYTQRISLGLLFGSFGDILLEMKGNYGVDLFIPGLICFLIGHLLYIWAFFQWPLQNYAKFIGFPFCLMYYGTIMGVLLSKIEPILIGPVAVYGLVIASMVFFAFNRYVLTERFGRSTRLAAIMGSLLFLSSDTMLSVNAFYSHFDSGYAIMITYYLGQFLISASAQFPLETPIEETDPFKESSNTRLL